MSSQDIQEALQRGIDGGAIDLAAAARQQPALEPLLPMLERLRVDSSFPVTAVTLAGGTTITLQGIASYGLPAGPRLPVVATLQVVSVSATSEAFELALAFFNPWTFGALFGGLGQTEEAQEGGLSDVPSVLENLRVIDPVLATRSGATEPVRFQGGLPASGPLARFEALFGPWPLQVEGTVILPEAFDAPPAMDLSAPSPVTTFTVGQVAVTDVRLEIVSVNDLDPEVWLREAVTTVNVSALITAGSISARLAMPLFSSEDWRLLATFPRGMFSVGDTLANIGTVLGVSADELPLPEPFPAVSTFSMTALSVAFETPDGSLLPVPVSTQITLRSGASWTPPIPFVHIRDVAITWTVTPRIEDPEGRGPMISTGIGGTLSLAGVDLAIEALIPDFNITARLVPGDVIPLEALLRHLFGAGAPAPRSGMAVTALRLRARPPQQSFEIKADVLVDGEEGWTVDLGPLVLVFERVFFELAAVQGNIRGSLATEFELGSGSLSAFFAISAEYPGAATAEGWTFRGEMLAGSHLSLFSFVSRFLGITPSPDIPDLILRTLTLEFTTGTKRYALEGIIDGRWAPSLFGTGVKVSAEARVSVVREPGQSPNGTLAAEFLVNRLRVKVAVNLGEARATQLFEVQFGDHFVKAVTAWKGDHQVLTVRLGGVTIGEILTFLANLAAPTLGFRLDPPWDQLNQIQLDNFLFTVDPTEKSVAVTYDEPFDVAGVMKVESVGLLYRKRQGKPVVDVLLTGRLGTKEYTPQKPLTWDAISDPPPSIGAGGSKLLDIRYLGFGQHVTRAGGFTSNSVRGTLDQLAKDLRPPKNPLLSPLFPGNGGDAIRYSPESEWLIGFDVTLLNTVSLGIIFNDPYIYGLAIGLQGERAKSLKGLQFEILYKKITNEIGMYRVELMLPEQFRRIELGAVTLTLGAVAIEIYTNGDFGVDLGFPWNRNFARSFSVQAFPFIGRGGLYFKKLGGETSSRVPQISNGTFSPVLEFGIGLAVGVGKEVVNGPLRAGVSVQLEAILTGVIAWFNPTSSGTPPAEYYHIEGTVGIRGQLQGVLDFEIIRITVLVEAYASATVVLESYRATLFQIAARVTVYAEVDILDLFTVSFSFDASIDASFTVGNDQPTPWILGTPPGTSATLLVGPPSRRPSGRLPAGRALPAGGRRDGRPEAGPTLGATWAGRPVPHRRERALRGSRARRSTRALSAIAAEDAMTWNPSLAVFATPRPIALSMLPLFSILNAPFAWDGTTPANATPDYRAAFLLVGETAGAGSPRNTLVEALLRWGLSAVPRSSSGSSGELVTTDDLATLVSRMKTPETRAAFSIANLATFFGTNAPLVVSAPPATAPSEPPPTMAFPVPPPLAWTSDSGDRDFAAFNAVGARYQWGLRNYLARFLPDATPAGPEPEDDPQAYESFASYVFRDFCLMVASSAVQAARDALQSWTFTLTEAASPADVAALFPSITIPYSVRAGDTLDSVAAELGATPEELLHLNPGILDALAIAEAGTSLDVALGVSPQAAGAGNDLVVLASGITFGIGTVDVQVDEDDGTGAETNTLAKIATRFGLPNAAALLDGGLAFDADVLRDGSTFTAPATAYESATFSRTRAAAVFFVHDTVPTGIPMSDWYAQTVADLNVALLQQQDATLPAGLELLVPVAFEDPAPDALPYVTVPGDTLPRIGAALALEQNFATGDGPSAAWTAFRDAVTGDAPSFTIPAATVTILPRESLAELADRTIVFSGDEAALVAVLANADVLTPLAILHVPNVQATTGVPATGSTADGATLEAIAGAFGLSVADLAGRVPPEAKIFPAGATLTIANLLVQEVEPLVARVMTGPAPDRISGSCSRFLMAGLRLPEPVADPEGHVAATGPLTALYELTGQQIPLPPPPAEGEESQPLTVTVTSNAPWVTVNGDPLVLAYPPETLAAYVPAASLALPAPQHPLRPIRVSSASRRQYGLQRRVNLQSAVPLPLVDQDLRLGRTGLSSVWPFDAELLDLGRSGRALSDGDKPKPPKFDIVVTRQGRQTNVTGACFATLIPFSVRRVAEAAGVYELVGVDVAWRQDLLRLWQAIEQDNLRASAWFLAPASRSSADPNGLAVLPYAASATFLVKTNLSGGVSTNAVPVGGADAFSSVFAFLRTLWEGSVVGGKGYSLVLPAGKELPSAVFASAGDALLQILVVDPGRAAGPGGGGGGGGDDDDEVPGLALQPYHNCLYVQRGAVEPAVTSLFAEEESKPKSAELVTTALVPPGTAGFTFTIARAPEPKGLTGDAAAQARLRQLFSLATWDVAGEADAPGLPIGPAADDGRGLTLEEREREQRQSPSAPSALPPPYWRYDQALPVSRFAPPSVAPDVAGLPPAALDPYRGIGGGLLQSTAFHIGFADVLGNVTDPLSSKTVTVPLAYTDPLVSVAGWPSTTASYLVSGVGSATLTVTLAPRPGSLLPSVSDAPGAVRDIIVKQAGAWASICYQLAQPGLTASIRSTLRSPATVGVAPLWRFAAASHLAANAATAVRPVFADGTLAAAVGGYGVTYEALATANADARMSSIFAGEPAVPAYAVFTDGETADAIALAERPGWPVVADGATLLSTPENANELPLRPDAVLRTNERIFSIEGSSIDGGSLASVAALQRTTAALLAEDNAAANDILRIGAVLVYDEVEVIVGETATPDGGVVGTLADAIAVFGSVGVEVTAAELGFTLAEADLLQPFTVLRSTRFVAADGETLAGVAAASETTVDALATMNAGAENLYDAGALLFLGTFPEASITVDPLESLQAFANRYATPAGALLAANSDRPLAGDALVIPGTVALPADVSLLAVPYTVLAGDTLDSIGEKFGTTGDTIRTANANMTGAIVNDAPVPGMLLVVPPAFLSGSEARTLAGAAARYGVSASAFAQANAAVLGVLASGATVQVRGVLLTVGATDTFNSLTTRLAALGLEIEVDALAGELSGAACIAAGARALLPPSPVTVAAPLGQLVSLGTPVKALQVTLRLERPAAVIHPDFPATGPVAITDAVIPAPSLKEEDSLALHAFVDQFQAALPTLRIASGKVAGTTNDLWMVDFGAEGIRSVSIDPPATPATGGDRMPRFFAFRPLYSELVARTAVPIASLDENGVLVEPVETDFQNVDVEVWAQRFLADFDLFLTAPYVAAMTRDAAARASLEAVVDAKTKLIKAVPNALGPALAGSAVIDANLSYGLRAAVDELQEQLGTSLAQAYSIAAVVQYDATVGIGSGQEGPPGPGEQEELLPMRLGGTATLAPRTDPNDTPYTLAGAKTLLEDGERSHVTFFLRVPEAKLDRAVTIDFSYDVLDLEFNIDDVRRTRGYQSSDFVVFPRPLDAARRPAALQPHVGRVTVPIPLRNFPMPPTFLGHTGLPSFQGITPPLEEAALWNYSISYAHEHAAQDEVIVTATFNIPAERAALMRLAETLDLASALAQYVAVADRLWALLAQSLEEAGTVPAAAAATFAQLAGTIANAWSTHTIGATTAPSFAGAARASGGPALEIYTYRVRVNVAFDEEGTAWYDTVELRIQGSVGPNGRWPSVVYESEEGIRTRLEDLGNGFYQFPVAVEERELIATTPRITLEWTSLPLTHYQNAEGSLFVQRNAELLPGLATSPDLVYTTARVTAPDILTPLLIWTRTIPFGADAATIGEALRRLFTGLFGPTLDVPLTIEGLYGYRLVEASAVDEAIIIDVPVTLYPNQPLTAATPTDLAMALAAWAEDTHPVSEGGRWAFFLTMNSQLDPITTRPLLIMNRLAAEVEVEV